MRDRERPGPSENQATVTRDHIKCVLNCGTNIFKQNCKIYSYSIFCHAALDRGSIALQGCEHVCLVLTSALENE